MWSSELEAMPLRLPHLLFVRIAKENTIGDFLDLRD